MKIIIEGKTYNTATADHICTLDNKNDVSYDDFKLEYADLYKTPNGRFFFSGCGGALTRWAIRQPGGGLCGSILHSILAISEQEAREFCEKHGNHEDYVRAFGECEEA